MSKLYIVVGNIGTVVETENAKEASTIYRHYCDESDRGHGCGAREDVTMMSDGEPVAEHTGYDSRFESLSGFMQPQITIKTSWYSIDSNDGIDFIETSAIGDLPGLSNVGDTVTMMDDPVLRATSDRQTDIKTALADYVHDTASIESIERIDGYGARLSAPGYLDCTEWSVFKTEHEAIVNLVDTYETDDDGDDSEREIDPTS